MVGMPGAEHESACPLHPGHALRHAVDATARLIAGQDADRLPSASLLNALEYFAGRGGWEDVTLLEVAQYSNLMDDRFIGMCSCHRKGRSKLNW